MAATGGELESATVPLAQYQKLRRDYEVLRKEYEDLTLRTRSYKLKLIEAREINRDWQIYIDKHPKKLKAQVPQGKERPRTESEGSEARSYVSVPSPLSRHDHGSQEGAHLDAKAPLDEHPMPTPELPVPQSAPVSWNDGPLNDLEQQQPPSLHHSSSQTTQTEWSDAPQNETQIKSEPVEEDDEPVFVSARQLKRERPSKPQSIGLRQQGTPSDPVKIKREDVEQSQAFHHMSFGAPRLDTQMSDLDALIRHVNTPRKRMKFLHDSSDVLMESADENTPPQGGDPKSGGYKDDHSNSQRSRSSRPRESAGPLTPLSTNAPNGLRGSESTIRRKPHTEHDRFEAGIKALANDDSGMGAAKLEKVGRSHRLNGLLQGGQPVTPRTSLSPRTHVNTHSAQEAKSPAEAPDTVIRANASKRRKRVTPEPVTAIAQSRASPAKRRTPRPWHADEAPPDPRPEEEPLRARPLAHLTLDDFRINPKLTGADFAFKNPLRGNENKHCAPGCTGPCCSALHRFMDTSFPPSARPSPGPPAPAQSIAAENTLLRAFLGHEPLDSMSASKRASLLDAARHDATAKKYGRHKQVYERPKSPPGFWRTDMPSTQELERDKAAAEEERRVEIERRWREAMRGDGRGRFVFRDEL